jgi:hypothetical protein
MLIDALAVLRFGLADRQGGLCFTVVSGPWVLMLLPGPARLENLIGAREPPGQDKQADI